MLFRIEALKVGGSLVHLLMFLLADAAYYEAPVMNTSRYEIAFPNLPPEEEHDLCALNVIFSHEGFEGRCDPRPSAHGPPGRWLPVLASEG